MWTEPEGAGGFTEKKKFTCKVRIFPFRIWKDFQLVNKQRKTNLCTNEDDLKSVILSNYNNRIGSLFAIGKNPSINEEK